MMTAIILAAGRGERIGTDVPKQFLEFDGAPLIVRPLRVFEESPEIDEILLVVSPDYVNFCESAIVARFGFRKIRAVIPGGAERYDSVYRALLACEGTDYVMIHDGARPFVTEDIIRRTAEAVKQFRAAAVGMPSKDTVKIADDDGFAAATPDRGHVWMIQTPQAFAYPLIREANEQLMHADKMAGVTDDAMIVEASGLAKVKLVKGSYENIKITTPDDLIRLKLQDHDAE